MNRPSGLAIVGYGLTATGFVQVAVTIAPRVAATIPNAGPVANIAGAAIALSVDVVWAALMHTTLTTYRNGQPRPAIGFGAATLAAVAASTALLAAVGHMGPWSVVPILAAVLLVADGIREHVSVSPETANIIRDRTAQIRDSRALARIDAQYDAHQETISGYRESTRLVARTAALADIKTSVTRANWQAERQIARAATKYGDTDATPDATPVARDATDSRPVADATDATPVAPKPATPPATIAPVNLSLVADPEDDVDARILDMMRQDMKPAQIAAELDMHRATVYRRITKIKGTA